MGILLFLIRRKYINGVVNNKSTVIPIDRGFELELNTGDWARRIIDATNNIGIPIMNIFFEGIAILLISFKLMPYNGLAASGVE